MASGPGADLEAGLSSAHAPPPAWGVDAPLTADAPPAADAPLVWDAQYFYIADPNGSPIEKVLFDAHTQYVGYWWELNVPHLDVQYWFDGRQFEGLKQSLPGDCIVLRHVRKQAFESSFCTLVPQATPRRLSKITLVAVVLVASTRLF